MMFLLVVISISGILLVGSSVLGFYLFTVHGDKRYLLASLLVGCCVCLSLATQTWYPLLVGSIGLVIIQKQIVKHPVKSRRGYIDLNRYPALISAGIVLMVLIMFFPKLILASKSMTLAFWVMLTVCILGTLWILVVVRLALNDRRKNEILIFRNYREKSSPEEFGYLSGMDRIFDFTTYVIIPMLSCYAKVTGLSNPHTFIRTGMWGRLFDLYFFPKNWGVRYGDDWKSVASGLMSQCKLAVFIPNEHSESILLELQMAIRTLGQEKIVLIIPNLLLTDDIRNSLCSENILSYDPSYMQSILRPLSRIAFKVFGPVNAWAAKYIALILSGRSPFSKTCRWLPVLAEIVPARKNILSLSQVSFESRHCYHCNAPPHYRCKACQTDWCMKCQEENGFFILKGRCGKCGARTVLF